MTRAARNTREAIAANCRPQPAIPLVLVFMITLLGAASARDGGVLAGWLIGAGILASCGLGIAAGFCSFAPPAAWLALALLGRETFRAAAGAPYTEYALWLGAIASIAMLGVQAWRVRTGRFVPTIEAAPDEEP
jgi:hypothetical protein